MTKIEMMSEELKNQTAKLHKLEKAIERMALIPEEVAHIGEAMETKLDSEQVKWVLGMVKNRTALLMKAYNNVSVEETLVKTINPELQGI